MVGIQWIQRSWFFSFLKEKSSKKKKKISSPFCGFWSRERKVQWIQNRSSQYYFIEKDCRPETLCSSLGKSTLGWSFNGRQWMLLSRLVLLFTVIIGYLVLYEWTSLSVSLSGSGGLRISFFVYYCSACLRKRLRKTEWSFLEKERDGEVEVVSVFFMFL